VTNNKKSCWRQIVSGVQSFDWKTIGIVRILLEEETVEELVCQLISSSCNSDAKIRMNFEFQKFLDQLTIS